MPEKYRSDIDGLRAIAVIAVVFFHGGFNSFSGGFVGVDVFFVISGYLITSLILPEIRSSTFRIANFYERRIRRLFPALYMLLLCSAIPAYFLLMPEELEDFGQSLAATSIFSSNFLFFTESGYFEGPSELKPLLHTWSLAIEEQYYLVFPAILLALHKSAPRYLTSLVVTLLIASLTLSIWSTTRATTAGFYLLPGRTWELMLGSLLAMGLIPSHAHRHINEFLGVSGLMMIVAAIFGFNQRTPFPGLAALLPTIGTALIIYSGQATSTLASRILSLKGLSFVGLISYSLYLWHWPVFAYAKHFLLRNLTSWEAIALVILSIGLAIISWRFIERPFRGRGGWLTQPQIFRCSAIVTLLLIGIGVLYDESEGLPGRLPPNVAAIASAALDKPVNRHECEGIKPHDVSYDRLCRINGETIKPSFIVWGDSHAGTFIGTLSQIAEQRNLNGINATSNGCVPLFDARLVPRDAEGECPAFNAKILEILRKHPEIDTLILNARWSLYAHSSAYGNDSTLTNTLEVSGNRAANAAHNHELFSQAWSATLMTLSELDRNLILIGPIPEIGVDVPYVLAKAALRGQSRNVDLDYADFIERNDLVLGLLESADRSGQITYVPVHPMFCDAQSCKAADEQGPLYFDSNHFSNRGAGKIRAVLEAAFDNHSN